MSQRKGRGTARRHKVRQPVQDLSLHRLGWYVRNCAQSPLARMLERALVDRFDLFREAHDDDTAPLSEDLPTGQKELSAREKLRALRVLLEAKIDSGTISTMARGGAQRHQGRRPAGIARGLTRPVEIPMFRSSA